MRGRSPVGPVRICAVGIAVLFVSPFIAAGQPAFDVASVKPRGLPVRPAAIRFLPGGRFQASNSTLLAILQQAYDVTEFQIAGAPDWVATSRFDIEAAAPPGDAGTPRLRIMLQGLLAERFGVRLHHETRPLAVYELVLGKSGSRLKPAMDGGSTGFDANPYGGYLTGTSLRISALVAVLQRWLDRPLVDKTGIDGSFDVKLSWAPGPENTRNAGPAPPSATDSRPDIFAAVQEQLGLRLRAAHDPLDILVIDNVQQPSPN